MLNRWAEFTFTEQNPKTHRKKHFMFLQEKSRMCWIIKRQLNYSRSRWSPSRSVYHIERCVCTRLHLVITNTHTHTHTPLLLMQNVRQNGFPTSPSCATNYTLSAGCTESNTTYRNYTLNHEKGSYFRKSCMKTSQSIITLSWRGSLSTRQLMSGASRDFMLHIS